MSQRMMADPVDTVKARVLVVDDETVVSLATKALTKAGFEGVLQRQRGAGDRRNRRRRRRSVLGADARRR